MCDFCGYSTSTKSIFDKHVNTHTQETLYSCEKCPFTSHSYRDDLHHMGKKNVGQNMEYC